METFAAQLLNARKAKGYTQEQLAEKLSVSRTNISRWESGKLMPDIETIKAMSRVLEVDFFTGESIEPPQETGEAPAPAEAPKKKLPLWLIVLAAVLVLAAGFFIVKSARTTDAIPAGQACVTITPVKDTYYAVYEEEYNGYFWFWDFEYRETAGIPFTIEEYKEIYRGDDGNDYTHFIPLEQVNEWFGTTVISKDAPLSLSGGMGVDAAHGVAICISGTDANGNKLTFTGEAALVQEPEQK